MQILRQQVGSFKQDIQIETGVHALMLRVSLPPTFGFNSNGTDDVFNKMTVEVNLNSASTGSKVIIPKIPVRDLFNMNTFEEGVFIADYNTVQGTFLIGEHNAALALTNGDNITLSYDGFPDNAIVDLFGIDAEERTSDYEHIEEVVFTGVKELNISDKKNFYIPITNDAGDGIQRVQIRYPNRTVTLEEDEIMAQNIHSNGIVRISNQNITNAGNGFSSPNGIAFGYDRLLRINVLNALSITVTPRTKVPLSIYTVKTSSIHSKNN